MTDKDFDPLAIHLVREHMAQLRDALAFIDGLTGADDEPVVMTIRQARILGWTARAWVSVTEGIFFGTGETKQ